MALTPVLQTLDGVDDAIKSFYTETTIKSDTGSTETVYALDIDDTIKSHPSIAPLRKAYDAEKEAAKTARAELAEAKASQTELPDGFTIEKWNELKNGKTDQAALIKMRETLEAERDDLRAKLEASQAAAIKNATDRDLTDALNEAGINNPTFAKAARTMLASDVKVGEDGKPFVETDMGPMPLSEHVKRWASTEGKDFVTPASGGGGRGGEGKGGSGGNPLIDKVPSLADLPEK